MKKIKDTISLLICTVVVLLMTACTAEDELVTTSKNTLQVVGRVTEFKEHTVTSRALKTNEEAKINNMSLFIFEEDGTCVSAQFVSSSRPVFVIDRSKLTSFDVDNAQIYMLANVAEMETMKDDIETLTDLQNFTCAVTGIAAVPSGGFPMMGHMDDVNLTESNANLAAVLEIPLTNLYAKMVFNLQVNTLQSVVGFVPTFRLDSWEVHNVPQIVAIAESEVTNVSSYYAEAISSSNYTGSNPVSGSNTLSFSFYLPEHKVNANSWDEYPSGIDDNEKQRFKPLRVADGTKPTFVRIKGSFTNHQGHMQSVSYDIYLGLDNWENFQVLRNYQYNNNVVIKGITNTTDGKEETISIDHRVNVEQSEFMVAMERETMLDSHFEVRPMRVTLKNGGKVVANVQSGCDWIRLETKTSATDSDATYCTNGKRKYFTTSLMNELGNTATVLSNADNCIWAYIDENTNIQHAQDGVRTATVTFNYYAEANADVSTATPTKTETYIFAQRYLYPVKVDRDGDGTKETTYYIEYFEEYLHDFDSDNDFNQTDYDGMAWGLDGEQLSHLYKAAYVTSSNDGIWEWILGLFGWKAEDFVNSIETSNASIYYDFYLTRDNPESPEATKRNFSGYEFTQEIVDYAGIDEKKLSLVDIPESAIEYCYNKNKRTNAGAVSDVRWYMPSIDEIEEITMAAYTDFDVFQDKYYWASQPAFVNNDLTVEGKGSWGSNIDAEGSYSSDDLNRARATKVSYLKGAYQNERSDTEGASGVNVGRISRSGDWWNYQYDISYEYRAYTGTELNVIRYPGNKPRSEKCRVRAIYKPQ